MQRNRKVFIGKCAAILAVPALIMAYQNGPPVGVSGVPGESQCSQAGCHVGTAPSAGGGVAISLSGGQTYTPGTPQTVTITITEPAANAYGFQATARRVSDLKQSAGTLSGAGLLSLCGSTDMTSEIPKPAGGCSSSTPLEFISHMTPQSSNTFTFTWTPPASEVGEVRIFVAANGANGNGQNTGDRIYTANATLAPQATGGGPRPAISSVEVDGGFRPGIVAGSWVAIKGTELAPTPGTGRIWNAATEIVGGRLPTSLDTVSVNVNGKAAAVYFVSATQINIQAPADDAVGPVEVVVVRNGVSSQPFRANVERFVPGFFMFDPEGRKFIAGVHADGTLLGKAGLFPTLTLRPAAPGNTVLLFGTGFGPTDPAVQTGVVFSGAARTTQPVRITVGGMEATVPFAGLSGAGLYQFNLVVPDLPNGDHAVIAEVGGVRSPETAFITIQR